MLSGNAPFYLGGAADEFLHKRLTTSDAGDRTILLRDLEELATVRVQRDPFLTLMHESSTANILKGKLWRGKGGKPVGKIVYRMQNSHKLKKTGKIFKVILHSILLSFPSSIRMFLFLQGCEGRSSNPVSVFFDLLNHPDADTGQEKPSLLEWRPRPELASSHVVLGKGRPGGCWDSLEGDVQTVSLGSWMELPGLKLGEVGGCRANCKASNRVNVSHVAKYYREYVKRMGLSENFVDGSVVTSVREIRELPNCRRSNSVKEKARIAEDSSRRGRHESEASVASTVCSSYEESNAMFRNDCLMLSGDEEKAAYEEDSVSSCCCSSPEVEDDDDENEEEEDEEEMASSGVETASDASGNGGEVVVARRRNSLGNTALGVQMQTRHYERHYGLYSQVS